MAEGEAILLHRFLHRADAQAFAKLVRLYAQLVHGTAFRILRNQSDAADITQETFIVLYQQAGRITGSLSAWLHRVATYKAFDLIRRKQRRRQREEAYVESRCTEIRTWRELSDHVDKALDQVDPPLRAVLLDYFMTGKTNSRIAQEKGVSQATISRHINDGLCQLRGILRRQGVLVTGAAALGTMLMESTAQAVPCSVMGELSKLAMVGTGSSGAGLGGVVAALTKAGAVKVTLMAATAAGVVSGVGYVCTCSTPGAATPSAALRPDTGSSGPRGVMRLDAAMIGGGQIQGGGGIKMARGAIGAGVGRPEEEMPTLLSPEPVDFSTPRDAVLGFLTLVDRGNRGEWEQHLAPRGAGVARHPYLRCLGLPVEVGDLHREGNITVASCTAMAHTPFTRKGKAWYPGECVPLHLRLVQENGLWKLAALSE